MKIATKNERVKRDLDKLITNPRDEIEVTLISSRGEWKHYQVKCARLIDLVHQVPTLSEHTALLSFG
jgi:DNA repair photolyase